jgi:hypothetical protein
MPLRLKTLKFGWGPLGGEIHVTEGDKAALNPLFVFLRDRRVLLESSARREAHLPFVTESVKAIRDELTATLQRLEPDSDAAPWIERLRAACREFLTSVESRDSPNLAYFQPALAQLRSAFRLVTNHTAAYYGIRAARDLADEMAAHPDP